MNRFYRRQVRNQFVPLSMQELMIAPAAKTQAHTSMLMASNMMDQLPFNAVNSGDRKFGTDVVRQMEGDVDNFSEALNSGGVDGTGEDFMGLQKSWTKRKKAIDAVNSRYDQAQQKQSEISKALEDDPAFWERDVLATHQRKVAGSDINYNWETGEYDGVPGQNYTNYIDLQQDYLDRATQVAEEGDIETWANYEDIPSDRKINEQFSAIKLKSGEIVYVDATEVRDLLMNRTRDPEVQRFLGALNEVYPGMNATNYTKEKINPATNEVVINPDTGEKVMALDENSYVGQTILAVTQAAAYSKEHDKSSLKILNAGDGSMVSWTSDSVRVLPTTPALYTNPAQVLTTLDDNIYSSEERFKDLTSKQKQISAEVDFKSPEYKEYTRLVNGDDPLALQNFLENKSNDGPNDKIESIKELHNIIEEQRQLTVLIPQLQGQRKKMETIFYGTSAPAIKEALLNTKNTLYTNMGATAKTNVQFSKNAGKRMSDVFSETITGKRRLNETEFNDKWGEFEDAAIQNLINGAVLDAERKKWIGVTRMDLERYMEEDFMRIFDINRDEMSTMLTDARANGIFGPMAERIEDDAETIWNTLPTDNKNWLADPKAVQNYALTFSPDARVQLNGEFDDILTFVENNLGGFRVQTDVLEQTLEEWSKQMVDNNGGDGDNKINLKNVSFLGLSGANALLEGGIQISAEIIESTNDGQINHGKSSTIISMEDGVLKDRYMEFLDGLTIGQFIEKDTKVNSNAAATILNNYATLHGHDRVFELQAFLDRDKENTYTRTIKSTSGTYTYRLNRMSAKSRTNEGSPVIGSVLLEWQNPDGSWTKHTGATGSTLKDLLPTIGAYLFAFNNWSSNAVNFKDEPKKFTKFQHNTGVEFVIED